MKNNLLNLKLIKTCNVDVSSVINNNISEPCIISKVDEEEFIDTALENPNDLFQRIFYENLKKEEDCIDFEERMKKELKSEIPCDFKSNHLLHAGYVDCMDEAIRFLIEEENISPEHPVVKNLKTHLEKSKKKILGAFSYVEEISTGTFSVSDEFISFLNSDVLGNDCPKTQIDSILVENLKTFRNLNV